MVEVEFIGEVIESNTTIFTCEATNLHQAPDFGSFVLVNNGSSDIVGVVYNTTTVSTDPSRKPMAYGQREEDLRQNQPQIFMLLRTYFSVLVVGHFRADQYLGYLPSSPPRIHSLVQQCTSQQYQQISHNLNYISAILSCGCDAKDELISAVVRQVGSHIPDVITYHRRVGSELRRLMVADYERFKTIIRRIRQ